MNRTIRKTLAAAAIVTGAAISAAQAQVVVTPYRVEGEPAPPTGANFQNFDRPNLNIPGTIAFTGDTDAATGDDVLYVGSTLVGQEGQPAPGVAGGIYGAFSLFESAHQLNASNDIIFENSLTGVPTTENVTLFTSIGGTVTPVAREGTPAAGIAGRLYQTGFTDMGLFNNGNFGFIADLDGATTDDSVLYRGATPVYREGEQVPFLPAGTTWDAAFTDLTWNGAGVAMFEGNTNAATNDQILVRDINGTGTVIAREGDTIAANGGPDTISLFLQNSLAENGRWAYRGNLDVAPSTSDAFILTENGYYRQEGESVPELPGVVLGNFNDVDMINTGDVLYLADLIGSPDPNVDEGYFLNDTLLLTDGTQVPGQAPGVLFSDFVLGNAFINEAGQIVFEASYLDGTVTRDGIFTMVIPEPASLGLAGIAALALLARRRRI